MHAVDWRRCVGELCRVARWRVVVDFPARVSASRRSKAAPGVSPNRMGRQAEAYRVMSEREVAETFRQHGFRVVMVRRQFVLPIALHKAIGRLRLTQAIERGFAALGCCGCSDRRSRWWPNGERARHGRDRVHRRTSRAVSRRPRRHVRALVRNPVGCRRAETGCHRGRAGRPHGLGQPRRAMRGVEVVYNIAALYREAGLLGRRVPRRERRRRRRRSSTVAKRAGVRRVVHCSTVGVHGDIEHPPANEDAPLRPGDIYQETKARGRTHRARRRRARRHRIRDRASNRHLRSGRPPAVQGVRRRSRRGRFVMLGERPELLSRHLHRRSLRRLSAVRDRARRGRTHLHPRRVAK